MGRTSARLILTLATALAAAASGAPAFAQQLGQGASPDVPVWRVLGALALCLALAVGAAFALKTRLRGATPLFASAAVKRRMQLIETVRLSHQVDVCLLVCDGREFIVAASPHGAVFMPTPLPDPAAGTAPEPATEEAREEQVAS